MRRILLVLSVAALMVTMLAVMAVPAFASHKGQSATAPNCYKGLFTAYETPTGNGEGRRNQQATDSLVRVFFANDC